MTVLTFFSGTSFISAAEGGSVDWPQWGGPERNFRVPGARVAASWPVEGPVEVWRRSLGEGYSGLVADSTAVFTLYREGDREILVSVDGSSGETLWQHSWPAPLPTFMDTEFGTGPHSTPLLVGELVIAVGATGRLVACERNTGKLRWSRELWTDLDGTPLERGYAASPIAFRDLVILPVGGDEGGLMAFRQADGAVAWRSASFAIAYASPILIDLDAQPLLLALLETELVALDPATGERRWLLPVSDERFVNVATPLFTSGDLLFFDSSEGARVLRLQSSDGEIRSEQLWLAKVIGSQVGNVIRLGDHLYGTNGRTAASFLVAVSLRTGEVAWKTREVGDCTLLVAGDQVLLLEADGTLRLVRLSPEGLETVSEKRVLDSRSWTAPTLVGGRLYLRNRREVVALELPLAEPTAP